MIGRMYASSRLIRTGLRASSCRRLCNRIDPEVLRDELKSWEHGDIREFSMRFSGLQGVQIKLKGPVGQGELPPTVEWNGLIYKVLVQDRDVERVVNRFLDDMDDLDLTIETSESNGVISFTVFLSEDEHGDKIQLARTTTPFDEEEVVKMKKLCRQVAKQELRKRRHRSERLKVLGHVMEEIKADDRFLSKYCQEYMIDLSDDMKIAYVSLKVRDDHRLLKSTEEHVAQQSFKWNQDAFALFCKITSSRSSPNFFFDVLVAE
mmetsp:Transcript_19050/g.76513  ORF Transcript_19050/g.76513 Transcript_19050/m.76513 type:complete len:263 (-) Transcript_19050:553-1341(-)|eukprot:CAMPEP_0113956206 /NCGR_PEP_ID=MMETSP0011_2-20120614/1907_1 /TAXON_ID=101924 /ORGANISM="Rhodosorus marinus" /LENGTH=262 /DNA_ID=CAMNT_0000966275 /DNA_START=10 /DNA_END=798 /DNA_ORIENTATION=+ /assembly_acc=CAM_ASM_000156